MQTLDVHVTMLLWGTTAKIDPNPHTETTLQIYLTAIRNIRREICKVVISNVGSIEASERK